MALNSPNPAAIVVKGLMDEANQDGKQYARQDGEWSEVAPAAGKNILINGNFTVDQRGVDWGLVAVDDYWKDRWIKKAGNKITQKVEEGNYEPNTQYTLSYTDGNGDRQSITGTSPASGHWDIAPTYGDPLYFNFSKIQLEKGGTATEFEREDYSTTLLKCQRYYEVGGIAEINTGNAVAGAAVLIGSYIPFKVTKRTDSSSVSISSSDGNPGMITILSLHGATLGEVPAAERPGIKYGLTIRCQPGNVDMSAAGFKIGGFTVDDEL